MITWVLRSLRRTGVRKGLAGEGRAWLVVGLGAAVLHFLHRKAEEPKATYSEKLKPGQTIVIRHLGKGADEGS